MILENAVVSTHSHLHLEPNVRLTSHALDSLSGAVHTNPNPAKELLRSYACEGRPNLAPSVQAGTSLVVSRIILNVTHGDAQYLFSFIVLHCLRLDIHFSTWYISRSHRFEIDQGITIAFWCSPIPSRVGSRRIQLVTGLYRPATNESYPTPESLMAAHLVSSPQKRRLTPSIP